MENGAVAEAAVVPAPDPIQLAIPKAYITLTQAPPPTRETALSIFRHANERLAPFKRIRRIEFVSELPKTISGKIRRALLRRQEHDKVRPMSDLGIQFSEGDLSELAVG